MAAALDDLTGAGVSIWLDDISRERLRGGGLQKLVGTRRVTGVTSNPAIFAHALAGGGYDDQLRDLRRRGIEGDDAVRLLMAYDIRWACDILRPVYDRTAGLDGRVSIEVHPRLAHDTEATVAETRGLWWLVDRPNAMIKIPATVEGLAAITAATAEGISVNVTLIFGLERYDAVLDAYVKGLEIAQRAGLDLSAIRSVASFFVSRVDTEVDARLDKIGTPRALALRGRAAIANARLAYERFEQVSASARWGALADCGANAQRPLWASTGVKNPAYPDTAYVTELVAAGVVNTMPEATLDAVADHGLITGDTVHGTYDESRAVFAELAALGIGYDDVVTVLEREGLEKFDEAGRQLADLVRRDAEIG